MPRWKPLCEDLDPEMVRFVVELRRLKDGSGLSLTQLATKTGRSVSSWERYLDGRALASYEALESLARLTGANMNTTAALYRAAKSAKNHKTSPPANENPDKPPPEHEQEAHEADAIPWTVAHLAAELRALRERTGSSLVSLATETRYSKSSWGRWLAGKALPPWHAVQALCVLADEPQTHLRGLWQLADSDWSGRGKTLATHKLGAAAPTTGTAAERNTAEDEGEGTSGRSWMMLLVYVIGTVLTSAILNIAITRMLVM